MTKYDEIVELLKLNTLKGVGKRQANGRWKVFMHIDKDGYLYGTSLGSTIDECLQGWLSLTGYTENEIETRFTDEIVPIPMKPKVLEVGDPVKILDIAKECGDYNAWDNKKRNMIGQPGLKIEEVYDNNNGVFYGIDDKAKSWNYAFPAYCVVPDFSERDEIKEAIALLEKHGKIKEGKILN